MARIFFRRIIWFYEEILRIRENCLVSRFVTSIVAGCQAGPLLRWNVQVRVFPVRFGTVEEILFPYEFCVFHEFDDGRVLIVRVIFRVFQPIDIEAERRAKIEFLIDFDRLLQESGYAILEHARVFEIRNVHVEFVFASFVHAEFRFRIDVRDERSLNRGIVSEVGVLALRKDPARGHGNSRPDILTVERDGFRCGSGRCRGRTVRKEISEQHHVVSLGNVSVARTEEFSFRSIIPVGVVDQIPPSASFFCDSLVLGITIGTFRTISTGATEQESEFRISTGNRGSSGTSTDFTLQSLEHVGLVNER